MTDTTAPDTYGRRRATVAEAREAAVAFAEPTEQPRPIDAALMVAGDRLDRLEHVIEGQLVDAINALERRLEYVLTPGITDPGPTSMVNITNPEPTPEDRRSPVARRVDSLADRADYAGDRVIGLVRRLETITAGVEA